MLHCVDHVFVLLLWAVSVPVDSGCSVNADLVTLLHIFSSIYYKITDIHLTLCVSISIRIHVAMRAG